MVGVGIEVAVPGYCNGSSLTSMAGYCQDSAPREEIMVVTVGEPVMIEKPCCSRSVGLLLLK